jgi:hypothetical protein
MAPLLDRRNFPEYTAKREAESAPEAHQPDNPKAMLASAQYRIRHSLDELCYNTSILSTHFLLALRSCCSYSSLAHLIAEGGESVHEGTA